MVKARPDSPSGAGGQHAYKKLHGMLPSTWWMTSSHDRNSMLLKSVKVVIFDTAMKLFQCIFIVISDLFQLLQDITLKTPQH